MKRQGAGMLNGQPHRVPLASQSLPCPCWPGPLRLDGQRTKLTLPGVAESLTRSACCELARRTMHDDAAAARHQTRGEQGAENPQARLEPQLALNPELRVDQEPVSAHAHIARPHRCTARREQFP